MRYFDNGFSEDTLCLIPLKDTTTAADSCSALLQFGQKNELTWDNLVSICTDGAPSMLGRRAGLVAMFRQRIGKPNLLSYHCIIHQQALCTKGGCGLQETMQNVVEIVNLIRARALNHRKFQNHLAKFDAEYCDVLFYNRVRWLSRGAVLEIFIALLPHIISFLEEICRPVAKLDTQFQIRLCVLADIFRHLNMLNMLLQGRQRQLCNLYEAVKRFNGKLSFFKVHAERGNFLHFRFTKEVCGEDAKQVLVGVVDSLQTTFNERFFDDVCCFFVSPFTSRPDVCHKLSQTFGVDEAALQEDFINVKLCRSSF